MSTAPSRAHTTSSPAPFSSTPARNRSSPYSSPFQQFVDQQPQMPAHSVDLPTQSPNEEPAVPGDMSSALSKRIQQLMKQLHGRMSGEVMFRRGADQPWHRAQCFIQEHSSSLMYDSQGTRSSKVLVPDLRGVHVEFRSEHHVPFIVLRVSSSSHEAHLRLQNQNEFDSWLAALLTWHHRAAKDYKAQQLPPANVAPATTSIPPSIPRRSSAARSQSPHSRSQIGRAHV